MVRLNIQWTERIRGLPAHWLDQLDLQTCALDDDLHRLPEQSHTNVPNNGNQWEKKMGQWCWAPGARSDNSAAGAVTGSRGNEAVTRVRAWPDSSGSELLPTPAMLTLTPPGEHSLRNPVLFELPCDQCKTMGTSERRRYKKGSSHERNSPIAKWIPWYFATQWFTNSYLISKR